VLAMAAKQPGTASDIIIRHCSSGPQEPEALARAITTEQQAWTRRNPTKH
jgi:hypothetical protein